MTRFTLLVVPDGKALLTTTEDLPAHELQNAREAIKGWKDGEWPVLIIPECEVIQVTTIDLDLTPQSALVS